MGKLSYKRIYQCEECLSSLGTIHHRALFGGYSLSIDDTVFAMVAHGDLYLRVCEQSAAYHATTPPRLLTLAKRGRPISLNYYWVDETLWHNQPLLLRLSALSLRGAQNEKNLRCDSHRLRNLPNITFQLELLLFEAGIHDEVTLRRLGAVAVWTRLRGIRKDLSISVLFALEGAIQGIHAAIIPMQRRQHLQAWAEMMTAKRKVRPTEE
ncbi:TfoX/Sxy family DNA transformation protein [Scandinavium sp. V105_16]|uniref:TfoX/Sxy family DNA transformation protein n=1 Tax=Scandinavium lactucae TaxID=3095028 RepID=A0AAJ2VUT6_9ENTR|nr:MULTISPECIES: TfoX/Sxy family DNA transformation protein [unclassified Scandinavium]MDX6022742.1 TfoX/Sxy family DNA transformation protein [Scandinavium sp. V105_16]MDX6033416.1 TfoX/Sxy family DNA transformation protein [Scandinavium sp. V105_12]MDX6042829.1 TfoX/Sxy family DNA transformation protein [Scandinavium sp. V105_6]MDX6052830.1 TfoX/Sxy family DNA transformation protein [Scandinavium sp. V105_1]